MDRNEYLHKVLDMVLRINEGAVSRKEGHPTAFFDFSGHTAMLTVEVYKNGWSADSRPSADFNKYIFMDHCSDEQLNDFLRKVRALAFSLKFQRRKEA